MIFIFPIILCILFIALIIAAPFIFKIIFKNETFFGYCKGICCYVVTQLILLLIMLIELLTVISYIQKHGSPNVSIGGL